MRIPEHLTRLRLLAIRPKTMCIIRFPKLWPIDPWGPDVIHCIMFQVEQNATGGCTESHAGELAGVNDRGELDPNRQSEACAELSLRYGFVVALGVIEW